MSDTPSSSPLARLRGRHGAKLIRFGVVSAFNVLLSQSLLFAAQTSFGWSAVGSNVFAVGVSAIPAYLLSRYWVWQKRDKNLFMREVVPFWSLAFLGLALSTAAVSYVEYEWNPHPLVINLTNLAAFGVVWVSKFVILDRVLFKHEEKGTWRGAMQAAEDQEAIPAGEAHFVGEGSYEGLEFHYYFFHPELGDKAELRGWISGGG